MKHILATILAVSLIFQLSPLTLASEDEYIDLELKAEHNVKFCAPKDIVYDLSVQNQSLFGNWGMNTFSLFDFDIRAISADGIESAQVGLYAKSQYTDKKITYRGHKELTDWDLTAEEFAEVYDVTRKTYPEDSVVLGTVTIENDAYTKLDITDYLKSIKTRGNASAVLSFLDASQAFPNFCTLAHEGKEPKLFIRVTKDSYIAGQFNIITSNELADTVDKYKEYLDGAIDTSSEAFLDSELAEQFIIKKYSSIQEVNDALLQVIEAWERKNSIIYFDDISTDQSFERQLTLTKEIPSGDFYLSADFDTGLWQNEDYIDISVGEAAVRLQMADNKIYFDNAIIGEPGVYHITVKAEETGLRGYAQSSETFSEYAGSYDTVCISGNCTETNVSNIIGEYNKSGYGADAFGAVVEFEDGIETENALALYSAANEQINLLYDGAVKSLLLNKLNAYGEIINDLKKCEYAKELAERITNAEINPKYSEYQSFVKEIEELGEFSKKDTLTEVFDRYETVIKAAVPTVTDAVIEGDFCEDGILKVDAEINDTAGNGSSSKIVWYSGDTVIGTGDEYTVKVEQIGKEIYAQIITTNIFGTEGIPFKTGAVYITNVKNALEAVNSLTIDNFDSIIRNYQKDLELNLTKYEMLSSKIDAAYILSANTYISAEEFKTAFDSTLDNLVQDVVITASHNIKGYKNADGTAVADLTVKNQFLFSNWGMGHWSLIGFELEEIDAEYIHSAELGLYLRNRTKEGNISVCGIKPIYDWNMTYEQIETAFDVEKKDVETIIIDSAVPTVENQYTKADVLSYMKDRIGKGYNIVTFNFNDVSQAFPDFYPIEKGEETAPKLFITIDMAGMALAKINEADAAALEDMTIRFADILQIDKDGAWKDLQCKTDVFAELAQNEYSSLYEYVRRFTKAFDNAAVRENSVIIENPDGNVELKAALSVGDREYYLSFNAKGCEIKAGFNGEPIDFDTNGIEKSILIKIDKEGVVYTKIFEDLEPDEWINTDKQVSMIESLIFEKGSEDVIKDAFFEEYTNDYAADTENSYNTFKQMLLQGTQDDQMQALDNLYTEMEGIADGILKTSYENRLKKYSADINKLKYALSVKKAREKIAQAMSTGLYSDYLEAKALAQQVTGGDVNSELEVLEEKINKSLPEITGVTVAGAWKTGITLSGTYNLKDVCGNSAEPILQWYIGDQVIGSGSICYVKNEYAGKIIRFGVTPVNNSGAKGDVVYSINILIADGSGGSGGSGGSSSGGSGSGNGSAVVINSDIVPTQINTDNPFTDIADHWAKKEIQSLFDKNIISGKSKGIFDPEGDVTRAEFAMMLKNAFFNEETEYMGIFNDVAQNEWYTEAVETAYKNGIVLGNNDEFRPQSKITREEMAAMIMRALKQLNKKIEIADTSYNDGTSISEWAYDAVRIQGIFKGDDEGNFRPHDSTTRAEAACVLIRALNLE